MFLLNHNFFKPFKSHLSFLFSLSFLFLLITSTLLLSPNIGHCYNPSFEWDANTESDLAGYFIYYKTDSSGVPYNGTGADEGNSPIQIPISSLSDPENPQYTIHGLSDTKTYFFVVTTYDTSDNESGFSNELSYQPSSTPENTPPEVTITAPANDSSFNLDDSITFTCTTIDIEDGNISDSLSWVSNLDGVIGSGDTFSTSALSAGTHTITVSATDSDDLSGAATITVTVLSSQPPPPNTNTSIVIDNGDPGTSFTGSWRPSNGEDYYGTQSMYSRTVNGEYTYDAALNGSYDVYLWWTTHSSRCTAVPVEIYDGTTLLDTVTVNHQVNGGQWNPIGIGPYTFSDQAKVSIVSTAVGSCTTSADVVRFVSSAAPGNTAPISEITVPATGSSFNLYDSITFRGTVTDSEDGNISDSLSWRSNLDGVIGSGAAFSTSALSEGTHNITASATDSGGLPGSATIIVTVLSPVTSMIIDNGDPDTSFTGTWSVSSGADPWDPDDPSATSLWSSDGDTYTWTFTPSISGAYEISMWWTRYPSRSTNIPVSIEFSGGTDTVTINQQINGSMWNSLGLYPFVAGVSYDITITSQPGPSSTCADAVRFVSSPTPGYTAP